MVIRLHHRVRMALRSFLRRRTAERELDEELRFHFGQMEAHAESRRRVRGFDQVKEACRDMRTLRPLDDVLRDLRFGARLLTSSPLFAIVAMLSLVLGIGANGAIFSLVNALVLRPLPVPQPEQLYIAEVTDTRSADTLIFSNPAVEEARDLLAGRAEAAAASPVWPVQIATPGSRQPASGLVQLVTGEYFRLLRQQPQLGRLLGSEDNRTVGQHPVAVISDAYFRRAFDRSSKVLGRVLRINDAPVTIVGVATPGFFGTTLATRSPDVWVPIMMQANIRYHGNNASHNGDHLEPWPPQREIEWLNVFVRVPAANLAEVAETMTVALQRDYRQRIGYYEDVERRRRYEATRVVLTPGSHGLSRMRDNLAAPLLALFAMVGLLLAIACANIASLLLARATNRHREMAIRLSIGAGRGRLIRQLLVESLLLALIGGSLGLLFISWGGRALLRLAHYGSATTNGGLDLSADWRVIGFTLGVSVFTGLLFGSLPALRSAGVDLATTLKSQGRSVIGSGGRSRFSAGKLLIVGQLAFSLLLLIVAALFTRSLQQLVRVDIGFDRERLLVTRVDPHAAGYEPAELPALYRRLVERLRAVPGVTAASMSKFGPFGGGYITSSGLEVEGYARGRDERIVTAEDYITLDYFRTVGLVLKRGRAFGPQDTAEGHKVTIINETMAQRHFQDRDPIGKRWGYSGNFDEHGFEIIGVVQDARYTHTDLKDDLPNMAYLPVAQRPDDYLNSIEIRTEGNPGALADTIRQTLHEAEPRLPVDSVEPLDARVVHTMRRERLLARLTMGFSAVALFLACLGLYGSISYAVTRRTGEIGVRVALGASRGAVQWLILREALTLVLIGLLVGLPLAFVVSRTLASLFYGVPPSDLAAHGAAVTSLVVISTLAAYLPARRASRVDPMRALRSE